MNTLDYSKGDVSRAKTAQYFPGQSATGPYYNPNLIYSGRVDQSGYDGRVYPGDASQYYLRVQNQPSQSYQQYSRQLAASQSLNPKLAQSEHVRFQVPQGYRYGPQMGQSVQYQGQPQVYYNQNAQYMPQQQQIPPQQPYQRQFLSFRPMMANEVNQVAQSRIPLDSRQPYHEYDFKIFCPACHQQYYNSQVEEHIEKHYLYNTDQFKLSNLMDTNAEVPQLEPSQQSLANQSRFFYPLVEPQEFQCKQLDEVNYLNKYKLHHEELNKKESNVKVKSQSTQFAKPPLQLRSENTDIYNCFDNIFSSNHTFDVNDLTKSNTIIAKKRQLDDWEKLRSHKEGYKIKTN